MPPKAKAPTGDCWGLDEGGSVDGGPASPPASPWSGEAWGTTAEPTATDRPIGNLRMSQWAIGEQNRYQEAALLGRGGMGEVWSARDARLARTVAIKRASRASAAGHRLVVEAEVCARLEHPNIVPVYDAGMDEHGEPWYAMRLVRGLTLQQQLDQAESLSARLELARPMLAVCQAVGYAHQHGVVHRDLKPANVMIGAHGEVQVLDWGLARRLSDPEELPDPAKHSMLEADPVAAAAVSGLGAALTQAGAVIGTPLYMSPEAARGEVVGPAGDVWSLGIMLHLLATGHVPQPGQSAVERLAVLRQGGALPAPLAKSQEIPLELLAIVAKALAPEPADRYRDATELAEDLARWLDGKRIRAHSYTSLQLLGRVVRAWKMPWWWRQ